MCLFHFVDAKTHIRQLEQIFNYYQVNVDERGVNIKGTEISPGDLQYLNKTFETIVISLRNLSHDSLSKRCTERLVKSFLRSLIKS